jgi:hypothetical protein
VIVVAAEKAIVRRAPEAAR